MTDRLKVWLISDRVRRCRLLGLADATVRAGESPRLIFALEAGVAHDLDQAAHHLRAPLHSVVANFQITAKTPRGSTSFEVARVVDDYSACTIEVPAGPLTTATSHELRVELDGVQLLGDDGVHPRVWVDVLPGELTHPAACTLAALRAPLRGNNKPAERKPSDDRVVHVAAAEVARLVVHARDRWGNRRAAPSAEDEFYVTVRPSGGAPAAAAADDEGCAVEARGDGSYAVTFSRRRAGTYEARAWLRGEAAGKGVRVIVAEGPLDFTQSGAAGDGLRVARAGVPTSFVIEARDRFGNLREAAEEKWIVRVRAPDVRAVATVTAAARASETVKFERRGRRCAVTLTVARAGEFEVTVAAAARGGRGERPLAEGLGWTLLVLPSASDSSVFRVDDGGGGVAGVASEVRIVPRGFEGAKGASQLVDGARKLLDQLSVEIHAPGDPPPAAPTPAPEPSPPPSPSAMIMNEAPPPVMTSMAVVVAAAPAEDAPEAAAPAAADGRQLRVLSAGLTDAAYVVRYVATEASWDYRVHVWVAGVPADGSPFALAVRGAQPHPPNCELRAAPPAARDVAGPLLPSLGGVGAAHAADAIVLKDGAIVSEGEITIPAGAKTAAKLWLITRDAHGNRCDHGLREDISLLLYRGRPSVAVLPRPDAPPSSDGAAVVNVELREQRGGRESAGVYIADLHTTSAGAYEAQAFVRGEPAGGAMRVVIVAGPMDLAKSGAAGDGLRVARAGMPTSFVIEARDAYGNLCGTGGERWLVRLTPDPLALAEEAEEAAAADYEDAEREAEEEAVERRPRPTVPLMEAAAVAAEGARIRDRGDGSYAVTLSVARAGRYLVHVIRAAGAGGVGGGARCGGGATELLVAPTAADPAAWRLLPGWRHTKAGCVRAGAPVAVTLQPRAPAPAAALLECAAQLVCECDATDAPPTAEVDATGALVVSFVAVRATPRCELRLSCAGVPLTVSPLHFGVVAGPPSALSPISSLVAKDPRSPLTAGSRSELLVRLRDAHDNVLDGGSLAASDVRVVLFPATPPPTPPAEGRLVARAAPTPPLVEGSVRAEASGGISAAVVPAAAGEYEGRVFVRGVPSGRPSRLAVAPAAFSLEHSGATGDGLRTARAGVPTSFVIEARDRFGNLCGVGGERWLVRLVPEAAEEATLADAARAALGTLRVDDGGDGSYTVTATLGRTGRYRWEIAHDDLARRGVEAPPAAPLPGGPWTLRVLEGPVDGSRCAVDGVTCAAGGAPGGELALAAGEPTALWVVARDSHRHALPAATLVDGLRASFVLARGGGDDDDGSDDDDDDEAEALWARGAAVSEAEAAQEGWAVALHAAALDALRTSRVPTHDAAPAGAAGAGDGAADRGCVCVCVGRVPAAGSTLLLGLTVGGAHVRGSPIRLRVRAGAACARYCELVGAPAAPVVAGAAAEFALRLRDAHGNWCGRRARADTRVRLLLRGPARVTEAEAVEERTPAGSGGLRLRARLIDAGVHAVLLSINGAVGPAAPAVTCVAGAPVRARLRPSARLEVMYGDAGPLRLVAGLDATVEVMVEDAHGNPVSGEAARLHASATAPMGSPVPGGLELAPLAAPAGWYAVRMRPPLEAAGAQTIFLGWSGGKGGVILGRFDVLVLPPGDAPEDEAIAARAEAMVRALRE